MHPGIRFKCMTCHKQFSSVSYRNQHQRQCQGITYSCRQCAEQFHTIEQLQQHKNVVHVGESKRRNRRRPHEPTPSTSHDNDEAGKSAKRARPAVPSDTDPQTSTKSTASISDSQEADPQQPEPDMLPSGDDELSLAMRQVYEENWSSIRSHHRIGHKVQDMYNFRIESLNMNNLRPNLEQLFQNQQFRFRINASFGFVMRNVETGQLRYYHSSQNIGRLFDIPHRISNQQDFDTFVAAIIQEDILEWARQQRPDTKWIVVMVTNLTLYVNKMPDFPIGCSNIHLPEHIRYNKAIIGLERDGNRKMRHSDNLCFFRALALQRGVDQTPTTQFEAAVRELFATYVGEIPDDFEGVKLSDLPDLELDLQLNINVFELVKTEEGEVFGRIVQRTHRRYPDTMNLNLYKNHFSFIKNMDQYCHAYECKVCRKIFKEKRRSGGLSRHEKTCTDATKKKFVGGSYHPDCSVFELLEDEGIFVPEEARYYPYRITYDYECYFETTNLPSSSDKLQWKAKHIPLSVSVCSNVPGYQEPKCFITTGDSEELVRDMIEYMHSIQKTASAFLTEDHSVYYDELTELLHSKDQMEISESDEEMMDTEAEEDTAGNEHNKKPHPLGRIKKMYDSWIQEIPVIGFNSGKYDINVVKPYLIKVLKEQDEMQFVVKKNNSFMCLQTTRLKFLDIRNYLAPGFDYATYLKAYKCSAEKGFFPYEWMDELDKLQNTALPDHKDFYSTLKNSNISDEEYQYCRNVWNTERMKTMKDYLVWYNNRDVVPFMEALEKQVQFYQKLRVDMFKDGISVPGLTLRYLFNNDQANFTLIDQKNADLHELIKTNNVGGPSIIFHRYHEANHTKIREHVYGENAQECQAVIGYDANALYLWCIMQDMPSGNCVRRRVEDNFKPYQPDSWGKTASEWLDYEAHTNAIKIRHKYNGKEKQIGRRCLPVDGWCAETNTVYQFHGCYWHGHECQEAKGIKENRKNGKTMEQLRLQTTKNSKYIQQCGYKLVELWECQWKKMKASNAQLRQFLQKYRRTLDYKQSMTEAEIIAAVKGNTLFGMVECDIEVPLHLKAYFSEMTPIFKNTNVTVNDIGQVMKEYADANHLMTQPRRTLIGSYKGEKILLATPLLKWYLEHGLEVLKIHQVVQYWPKDCFKQFGENVSQARRNGDKDPDQAIIADTMKLLGNSAYGKTITNKDRHRNIYFCTDDEAPKKVNEPTFRQLNILDEDLYEVEMRKKKITYNLPLHIGFFVYQYAKLKMLEFYYDFLDKYLSRQDYQYIEMDTDSAYIAISGKNIEDLVKPHLKKQFYEEWSQWFPAEACEVHQKEFVHKKLAGEEWTPGDCCINKKKYDRRTPGLFKVEWEGTGMIALCSKTYFGWGEKNKCSTKGISKTQNVIDKDQFLQVLQTKQSSGGVNIGFQVKDNAVYTYRQERNALSYLYPKRQVLEDGITTQPLMI